MLPAQHSPHSVYAPPPALPVLGRGERAGHYAASNTRERRVLILRACRFGRQSILDPRSTTSGIKHGILVVTGSSEAMVH